MAMAGMQAGQLRGRGELGSWGAGWDPHPPPPAGWLWGMAAAALHVAPSPGLRPKEQAQVHHRKVPTLSTS